MTEAGAAPAPPEWIEVREGARAALVRSEWEARLIEVLFRGAGCVPWEALGRGGLYRFAYPGGGGVLRHYRRGGLVRWFIADRYLLDNRPRRELEVLRALTARGFPVPAPLGVCWERRGPWYRGAIATAEVNGVNLLTALRAPEAGTEALLRDCGARIREMHDLGVWHADLHPGNVLVTEAGPWLLDFDNARLMARVSDAARRRNLLRFLRGMRKHGLADGFGALCAGYGGARPPGWLAALGSGRGGKDDAATKA